MICHRLCCNSGIEHSLVARDVPTCFSITNFSYNRFLIVLEVLEAVDMMSAAFSEIITAVGYISVVRNLV